MTFRPSQILPVIAVLALLAVGWAAIRYQDAHQPDVMTSELVDQDKLVLSNALPDSISIQGLREHTYTGSDFRVEDVLLSGEGFTQYAISYQSEGLTITGSLVKPAGAGPFPVIIMNHAQEDTATYTTGSVLQEEMYYLARHGYVAVQPDYRNHAGSDVDPDVEVDLRYGYVIDVINAIVAVKQAELSYVDVSRVGMIGHSMGGAIALGVAVSQPLLVQAYVLYSPISVDMWTNIDHWMKDSSSYDDIIERHGTLDTNPRFWQQASPGEYLDSIKAPILIHHGTADEYVPITYSEDLVARIENKAGAPVIFDKYLDQGHDLSAAFDESQQRTVAFFDEYIR